MSLNFASVINLKRMKARTVQVKDPSRRRWRIVRGDTVQVTRGIDKGKRGKVLKVRRKYNHVIIDKVNIRKKEIPEAYRAAMGGKRFMHVMAPIPYHHIALIDPVSDKPTRIVYKWTAEGKKVRISKRSGAEVPKPDPPKRDYLVGPKDTDPTIVRLKTFDEDTLNPLLKLSLMYREQHKDK